MLMTGTYWLDSRCASNIVTESMAVAVGSRVGIVKRKVSSDCDARYGCSSGKASRAAQRACDDDAFWPGFPGF